jgi:hypothetical protein
LQRVTRKLTEVTGKLAGKLQLSESRPMGGFFIVLMISCYDFLQAANIFLLSSHGVGTIQHLNFYPAKHHCERVFANANTAEATISLRPLKHHLNEIISPRVRHRYSSVSCTYS